MNVFYYGMLVLLLSLDFQNLQAGGWLERKAEGWFWYEDMGKKETEEEIPVVENHPQISPHIIPPAAQLTATEEVAAIRKELEEKLSEAILRPTDENLSAYMKMQQTWINQSAYFSSVWLKNLLNHPHLDSRVTEFPATQYGVQVKKANRQRK